VVPTIYEFPERLYLAGPTSTYLRTQESPEVIDSPPEQSGRHRWPGSLVQLFIRWLQTVSEP